MKLLLRSTVVAIVVALALPASAAEVTKSDPNDSDGLLDVREVVIDAERNGAGFFTIKTFEGFNCGYLKKSSGNKLKLLFDDGRDGSTDLIGRFECQGGDLLMFLHGKETGNNYEPLKAKRPSKKVVKVAFQLDISEFTSDTMGVKVRTVDASADGCTEEACKDKAPNRGSVKAY